MTISHTVTLHHKLLLHAEWQLHTARHFHIDDSPMYTTTIPVGRKQMRNVYTAFSSSTTHQPLTCKHYWGACTCTSNTRASHPVGVHSQCVCMCVTCPTTLSELAWQVCSRELSVSHWARQNPHPPLKVFWTHAHHIWTVLKSVQLTVYTLRPHPVPINVNQLQWTYSCHIWHLEVHKCTHMPPLQHPPAWLATNIAVPACRGTHWTRRCNVSMYVRTSVRMHDRNYISCTISDLTCVNMYELE